MTARCTSRSGRLRMFLAMLHEAWRCIGMHRLRTGLTMLGIVIGVSAVVMTIGIGMGSQQAIRKSIATLGTNVLVVSPAPSTIQGVRTTEFPRLTRGDATVLATHPSVAAVAPVTRIASQRVTAIGSNWSTPIIQ